MKQLNLGSEVRAGARDYYELCHERSWRILPDEALNELSASSGRLFTSRFGFFVSRPVRTQLLEIQQQLGISDWRVTQLWVAGVLNSRQHQVILTSSPSLSFYGQSLVTIGAMCALLSCAGVLSTGSFGWRHVVACTTTLCSWYFFYLAARLMILDPQSIARDHCA